MRCDFKATAIHRRATVSSGNARWFSRFPGGESPVAIRDQQRHTQWRMRWGGPASRGANSTASESSASTLGVATPTAGAALVNECSTAEGVLSVGAFPRAQQQSAAEWGADGCCSERAAGGNASAVAWANLPLALARRWQQLSPGIAVSANGASPEPTNALSCDARGAWQQSQPRHQPAGRSSRTLLKITTELTKGVVITIQFYAIAPEKVCQGGLELRGFAQRRDAPASRVAIVSPNCHSR